MNRVHTFILAILLLTCPAHGVLGQEVETAPSMQATSASQALQYLLDRNMIPPGPLGGDGATIAGVLAGQSLTFPIASSAGAFVTRNLGGFGPAIPVATSGSFGSLFAERGYTNGRGNLSVGLHYQRKSWRSLSGVDLQGFELTTRAVFRNDVDERGPLGTVEEFKADIDFDTDVLVLAANYGLTRWLDLGVSLPWVRATVTGTKRLERKIGRDAPTTLNEQRVSGRSEGLGDAIVRFKYRVPLPLSGPTRGWWTEQRLQLAVAYDLRLPTGRTARLDLDCQRPPCANSTTQEVPDLGLGKRIHKWSLLASGTVGRLSPHVNFGYVRVPAYPCDPNRFGNNGACRGSVFEIDRWNDTQDAKDQNLSDEWNATIGLDYELRPYSATLSIDVIGRQLIRAGRFYMGEPRLIYREDQGYNDSVSRELESRHGNVNTLLGVIGWKFRISQKWVASGSVLFPLNQQGLQPSTSIVAAIERALGK